MARTRYLICPKCGEKIEAQRDLESAKEAVKAIFSEFPDAEVRFDAEGQIFVTINRHKPAFPPRAATEPK